MATIPTIKIRGSNILSVLRNPHGVPEEEVRQARLEAADLLEQIAKPIDMILHCPSCHLQHIDAEDRCVTCPGGACMCVKMAERWTNPPHRSHLCHGCGFIWRPADVATNGVAKIQTHGAKDSARFDVD